MKNTFLFAFLSISISIFSQINSPNGNNIFYYNGAADVTFRYQPRGSGGRAFVHADYNVLSLNFGSDFKGGTSIGNDVFFKDGGNSYIATGNVGIGTIYPLNKLSILDNSGNALISSFIGGKIYQNYKYTAITYGESIDWGKSSNIGYMSHQTDKSLSGLYFTNYGESEQLSGLFIRIGGNVGIGTANPTSKLTVAGNIASREVKVTVDAGADFVFEKNYNLPSLDSIEKYIKENKHLPEINSAQEMQKDGINLSEMNIKLLQKIEEMTLYMIEQNKQITNLKDRLDKVELQSK